MKKIHSIICLALAAVMTAVYFPAVSFAASNSGGAYNVGNGILISSTDISSDGVITLEKNNVQYDPGSSKRGTAVFADDGEKTTKAVTDIFGASYTYAGVIDYVGSGKGKNALTVPINITTETNYYVYVLARAAGAINMWIDNSSATIKANTAGAKQSVFAVEGTNGVAYALDCGNLTAGGHTLTFDGAAGAWLPDVCAVAVYPEDGESFKLPYQNESLSFEERAADLVARMTLEEKIAQLGYNNPAIPRLGVSAYYYWREAAHGVARQGKATSFPSSIAVSNTWDPDLYGQEAEIISTEARVKNNQYNLNYWSPTINMSRDPRWGRNEESLGEDTLLTTRFGDAFVNGMQGGDEKYIKTIATVKHFLANNCEGERQTGSSEMTESELRDYYAKAFANIVEDTDPGAIMSSYNATTVTRNGVKLWDYLAMPANDNILTGYLRRSWGFSGFVTGDCGAVADLNGNAFKRALFNYHGDTETPLSSLDQSATVAYSIQAGNEMDCGNINTAYGLEAIKKGYLSEDELDIAVFRIFLQRFKTGEFDDTETYRTYTVQNDLETDESVTVAEKLAEESIVLLENKADSNGDKILPLDKNAGLNIALVGEMASQTYVGDYSGEPEKTTSPYEGLQEIFGKSNVHFLGHVDNDTPIMNVKNIKFVDKNGNETAINLSSAVVTGAALSGGVLTDVTPAMQVKVSGVDFSKVTKVKADIEVPQGSIGGTINICYESASHPETAIESALSSTSGYVTCEGAYTGADGGYNGSSVDLYITATAHSGFDMTAYKTALDASDVIITYSSTMASNVKDADGQLTDCKESNDRTSIKIPQRDRENIEAICNAYPEKTVVFMQSAGEMDVTAIKDKCRAILWTGYNGQTQGEAMAKVLSGDVNPSGKLSTTWYDPEDLKTMTVGGTSTDDVDTNGTTKITWKRNNYGLAQKYSGDTRTWQGRTYMYYGGTPQYPFGYGLSYTDYTYSNLTLDTSDVEAGGEINVSVDVENTGSSNGTEIVQIYMSNKTAGGTELPLRQLVGFKRVDLSAGETKTVEIAVDTDTLSRWSEDDLKNYVPTGEYTLYAGKNVTDKAVSTDVTVTGTLASKIKTVYAVPTGVTVTGAYDEETETTEPIKTISPQLSVVMTDEAEHIIENGEVTYTSADRNIATADADGTVKAGVEEGVTTITASVTINGETKSVSFPVVTKLQAAIPSATRTQYLSDLGSEYAKYTESDYRADFWTKLTKIYTDAKAAIENEVDAENLDELLNTAKAEMAAIRDHLKASETAYTVTFEEGLYYRNANAEIVYNGDEDNPSAKLITAVYGRDNALKSVTSRDCDADMTVNDSVSLNGLAEGDIVQCFVWDSAEGMSPLAKAASVTIQKPPAHVEYNLSDAKYDRLGALASGERFDEINGVGGYGDFSAITNVSYSAPYNGKTYTLTGGFQGTKGSLTKSNIYFVPFDCYTKAKVTVFFDSAAEDRKATIRQGSAVLGEMGGTGNKQIRTLTVDVTDLTKPVYFVPDGQKVSVYMIVVDYE